MAAQLIDTLHEKFKPEKYEDEYRAAVLEVVKRKAKGEDIVSSPTSPRPTTRPTSWRRSKASLDGAKKGRR